MHECLCHDSIPSSTHAYIQPQLCVHSTDSDTYRHLNVHMETSTPAQTLASMHRYTYLHLTYSNSRSVHVYATQGLINGHVCRHMCTGTLACIQARTHTFLLRSTQTHPEVSLHHVGPKITAVSHPPGVASLAGGPKQLPPVPVIPALNPDEDYVIPIKDAPVTDYENKDGGWGPVGLREGAGGAGSRPMWHPVSLSTQCFLLVGQRFRSPGSVPRPQEFRQSHTLHPSQVGDPLPQPLPHAWRAILSLYLPSPEPRGLPSGPVKKLAIGSAQGVSATTGTGLGAGGRCGRRVHFTGVGPVQ